MAAWFLFILFERQLAAGLLQVKMNPLETPRTRMAGTTWRKVVAYLKNPVTWKGLLYLFLKFPLGVGFFSVGTSFLAITISFLAAPIGYRFFYPEVWFTMESWRVIFRRNDDLFVMAHICLTHSSCQRYGLVPAKLKAL